MDFLAQIIENLKPFGEIKEAIDSKKSPISTYGTTRGFCGLFTYGLYRKLNKKIIVIGKNRLDARGIYEDLINISPLKIEIYPEKDIFLYDRDSKSTSNLKNRLKSLEAFADGSWDIAVTTLKALGDKISTRENFKKHTLEISLESQINLKDLSKRLLEMGYERYPQVEGMGQFSIRGSIIDISTNDENYRLELFDDTVDSIRTFDLDSQRSIESLKRIGIFPVVDILIEDEDKLYAKKKIEGELKKSKLKGEDRERLMEKFSSYNERLGDLSYIKNPDLIIPYLKEDRLSSFLEFIEEDFIVLLNEPRDILERENSLELELKSSIADMISFGEALPSHKNIYYPLEDSIDEIKKRDLITLNSLLVTPKEFEPKSVINFKMKSTTNYSSKIKLFREDLDYYLANSYRVILLGGSEKRAKRLFTSLRDMGYSLSFSPHRHEKFDGNLLVTTGTTHDGCVFEVSKIVLLNYGEIYGTFREKKRKEKKKTKSLNFEDLKIGDYVVHESHGIGRYVGTQELEIYGIKRDYIVIKYFGDDKLFLPIESLDLIYKYIGDEKTAPKINKLNSIEWTKTKRKAKKSIDDMADDLIKLYAKRKEKEGFAFSKDSDFQREFEDAFIYEETEGQLKSAEEIKADMEKSVPMDRLLCADVGYGKTEVALRAAFKAILDGKQVAFLVPTTILAQQHYNTMMERFKDFPVEVAILSRFRSKNEQAQDIKKIKSGVIDIVVGTHRLLSKDVAFKDLGLLIIDEEQRFGVRHKEKLKMLKENIDSLTLSATPIPRTLQMSMLGIRDMSVIEDPPEERFPVTTYVLEYNPLMVREVILKEVERGGQVYFVYNKVAHMEYKLRELEELVPEVSFAMANGQMTEEALEKTMLSFLDGEIDVLLCSTIIETGMDVQNANTMIVTDANRLGLSQLYQLRGRIGRSSRTSHAYFTYEKDASISEIAQKRLKTIKEFTEFGSGFKIALRDLEIRGSGSILGSKQHGHIQQIGYDLYMKYLKNAIGKLKGFETHETIETTIDLKMDSFIPKDYIEDDKLRLEIYKKISVLESEDEYRDLLDELIDRFSDVPRQLINLMDISLLRYKASIAGIISISQKNDEYYVKIAGELKFSAIKDLGENFEDITYAIGEESVMTLENLKDPIEDLKKLIVIINSQKNHNK
ncbi:transcription-repair coupling factor [Peptoniphilus raoultii]|uniref:transcription-repair coupling factor n=1 Tax=Peptoniphilus raoultii TaxID=1776387 RepID=UPI0008DA2B27|nr:transcription-repair coupling factor [Peptoniphilus raoultii]